MQSSDEDALSGIGGSVGSGMLLSHKSSVDLITKVTMILGCCLIVNSLALTIISKNRYSKNETMIEDFLKKQDKKSNKEDDKEEKKIIEDKTEENKEKNNTISKKDINNKK